MLGDPSRCKKADGRHLPLPLKIERLYDTQQINAGETHSTSSVATNGGTIEDIIITPY